MHEKTTTPFATSSSLAHQSPFVFNKHAVRFLPITPLSVSGPHAIFAWCDPINKCFDADLFGTLSVLGSGFAGIVFLQVSAHYHLSMILMLLEFTCWVDRGDHNGWMGANQVQTQLYTVWLRTIYLVGRMINISKLITVISLVSLPRSGRIFWHMSLSKYLHQMSVVSWREAML